MNKKENREVAPVSPEPPQIPKPSTEMRLLKCQRRREARDKQFQKVLGEMSHILYETRYEGLDLEELLGRLHKIRYFATRAMRTANTKLSSISAEVSPTSGRTENIAEDSNRPQERGIAADSFGEAEPVSAKPETPEPANPVSEMLGKYLNTMIADLGIFGKGQYLRDLFSKYEKELAESLSAHTEHGCRECRDLHNTICGCSCHDGESASPRMPEVEISDE